MTNRFARVFATTLMLSVSFPIASLRAQASERIDVRDASATFAPTMLRTSAAVRAAVRENPEPALYRSASILDSRSAEAWPSGLAVRSTSSRGRTVWKGALIGAGIGTAAALIAAARSSCEDCMISPYAFVPVATLAGACVGALVGLIVSD